MIQNKNNIIKFLHDCELFVFDFDGVLADSVNIKADAFAEMYRKFGRDTEDKVITHHMTNGGMSRYEKFKFYHSEFLNITLTLTDLNLLSSRFSSIVFDKVVKAAEIPGAEKFLENVCGYGKLCVVNSATPEGEIKAIIEERGMNAFFSHVVGSPSSKNENLMKLLLLHKVEPSNAIFFGDADADFLAAKEVGVGFVGVGQEILKSLGGVNDSIPVYHISDFTDLDF